MYEPLGWFGGKPQAHSKANITGGAQQVGQVKLPPAPSRTHHPVVDTREFKVALATAMARRTSKQ